MIQNKTTYTFCLTLPLLMLGCSDRSPKFQDVEPRLHEGFYSAEDPSDQAVPLVAIRNVEGRMSSYAYLTFECEGSVSSSYNRTSYSLSGNPRSLSGPSVSRLDRNCEIETGLKAESADTIRVFISYNQVAQDSYVLKRIEKQSFIQKMKDLIQLSPQHDPDDRACMESLEDSCANLSLIGGHQ